MKYRTDGVSEVVGAMLLITVVVVSVAVVGVGVVSNSHPPIQVPHIDALAVKDVETGNMVLVHNGGDDLDPDEFALQMDDGTQINNPQFDPRVTLVNPNGSPAEWPWSVGEKIVVDYPTTKVGIVSSGGGGSSLTAVVAVAVNEFEPPGSDIPQPPPPERDCPCVDEYIIFSRCGIYSGDEYYGCCAGCVHGPSSDFYGNLNFTISKEGSYFTFHDQYSPYTDLHIGDRISIQISQGAHPTIKILMNGNNGWSISAEGTGSGYVKVYKNDQPINRYGSSHWGYYWENLDDSWITGSTNLSSTLTMVSSGTADSHTSITVNGLTAPIVDTETGDTFTFSNLAPATVNLWIVMYPYDIYGEDKCGIYIGKTSQITRGSSQIYPVS